jgi:hypothetical protein
MKRHATDLVSLLFGLSFVALASWWLAGSYLRVDLPHPGWLLAGGLVALGGIGIVASLRPTEPRPTEPRPTEPRPTEPRHIEPQQ